MRLLTLKSSWKRLLDWENFRTVLCAVEAAAQLRRIADVQEIVTL
jgi:hypothetical protein